MPDPSQINPVALDFGDPGNIKPVTPKGMLLGKGDVRLVAGRSRAREVADTDFLPRSVDVVVIGGGIVGTMAALTLAERGVSVALCEKGAIAGEASGRAQGYLFSHFASPLKAELLARSKELWSRLPERVTGETGYRRDGIVAPLDSDIMQANAEAWIESMRDAPSFEARILSSKEVSQMLPSRAGVVPPALYTPTDGSAEPVLAAPAIVEEARRKGAIILQNCAVRGVESKAGRISGVVTEKGRIDCQSVILAAGAWTPRFARAMGIRYIQSDVYMSMMTLKGPRDLAANYSASGYGLRPRLDGSYSFGAMSFAVPITPGTFANMRHLMPSMKAFKDLSAPGLAVGEFMRELIASKRIRTDRPSPFELRRVLTPSFNEGPSTLAMGVLQEQFPSFKDAAITERWTGIISPTIDNMPLISSVDHHPGLYIGSGFANGFTFGTAAGEALADLATGRAPAFDLNPYRLSRFSDGSTLGFHM